MKIEVMYAEKKHKDFIIHANNIINNVNSTKKFHCLIAEYEKKPVGMILYSYFYWANDGEVLWISQMFVEEEYRDKGIFFSLIDALKQNNKDIKIISCATGDENKRMQKILKGYGAKEINLKFYYKKI